MGSPRVGDIVRHSQFGEGQVIEVKEGKVDVAFAPDKIHTILVFFLDRIGHEPVMRHTPQPKVKRPPHRRRLPILKKAESTPEKAEAPAKKAGAPAERVKAPAKKAGSSPKKAARRPKK